MAKQKTKYIVTNLYSGEKYETLAVSEADAINNIHYKLWFGAGYWTEMTDFEAKPERVITLLDMMRDFKQEQEQKQQQEQYHQMSLFEVVYDG